jgi:hypothetical protein
MRFLACFVASFLVALPVQAQRVPRGPLPQSGSPSAKKYWVSLGMGYTTMGDIADGATEAIWRFGDGVQWRFGLERQLASGVAIGGLGTYSRMPLLYDGGDCQSPCNAHATVTTFGAFFHAGGGTGFHQVIQVFAGVMRYDNFESDSPRAPLEPTSANHDFAFSLGYGFGYTFGTDWELVFVPEYLNTMHERTGLAGNAQVLTRHYALRLGVRVGY